MESLDTVTTGLVSFLPLLVLFPGAHTVMEAAGAKALPEGGFAAEVTPVMSNTLGEVPVIGYHVLFKLDRGQLSDDAYAEKIDRFKDKYGVEPALYAMVDCARTAPGVFANCRVAQLANSVTIKGSFFEKSR